MLYVSAIKLAQVERYRLRLKERERRKKLSREYGLITSSAQAAAAVAATVAVPGAKPTKSPYPKKKGKDDR